MRSADPKDTSYYQGIMDGITLAARWGGHGKLQNQIFDGARESIADGPHVCYSSIIGPYCVICRKNMKSKDYSPYWSDSV